TSSLNRWIKQFLTAGLAGLIRPEHNHRYTLQTKRSAVKAYLSQVPCQAKQFSIDIKFVVFPNYINGLSGTIVDN
ncbi:hypothetical protein PF606_11460, partial [Limosilactobacillus fermentum]|nr:hypothetical protein [Limosilactobacillus fermentum]